MSEPIFEQLSQYFANRNFDLIPTDSSAVSMYGTYEANYLYLINLIELGDGLELDFERYLEYKQLTMEQFAGNQADKTILLNIIVSDKTDLIYDAFNYTPDLSESFIDVIWLVDKVDEKLVIPKKQMKNVLHIEKDIRRLLTNEKNSYYELEQRNSMPVVTYILLATNVLVWLFLEWWGSSTDTATLLAAGAMKFDLVVEQGQYYRLFNAMFLHIGFTHLFYNMFSLYIFGSRLEKFMKPLQAIIVYLGAGLVGSIASMAAAFISGNYAVSAGASGAVYGLMGGLLFISLIHRRPIEGLTTYVLWLFFILGIVYSVVTPNVDIFAHLGGFVGGVGITAIVLISSKKSD